ncbi:hypothetical protein ACFST9_14545 [Hymenobacter monticola]|uniref:Uncharacterized protein n=1 Tax=Hymenobacter monticola TaxID=1705399 RepID=A0ABY4BCP0_9BACT|nr:hypothetical protein [Hymenobacter monticola]UOE36669.1 hypothetical protein MTP16_25155 [Hymenobacter monticola]
MSFRGALRSFAAAGRRIEREQQRRAREATRHYKQLQKQQESANAAEAVAQYEDYLSVIKSIHHDCGDTIDWQRIWNEPAPVRPPRNNVHEAAASAALEGYRPGLMDKLLKREADRMDQLRQELEKAKARDQQERTAQVDEYQRQLDDWRGRQELAKACIAKDQAVYQQVLEDFNPFDGVSALGSQLGFRFFSNLVEVDLHVNSPEVIPDFILTRTAGGKLSRKAMPTSKFNEIYQDYVCGCVLRISREITAHLPVDQVVVNAMGSMLNPATGLIEEQVIVSVAIPRATLSRLNFATLDPSDSMRNFNHNMKFAKTTGFQPVSRVAPVGGRP